MFWADADGIVTADAFSNFCQKNLLEGDATMTRLTLFTKLGYRTDLRKEPQPGDSDNFMQVRDVDQMPRYKLANNKTYYELLNKLPGLHSWSHSVRTVLEDVRGMLCTNESILSDVFWLHDRPEGKGVFTWDMIFDEDTSSTLYTLEIIESIIKSSDEKSGDPTYANLWMLKDDWI